MGTAPVVDVELGFDLTPALTTAAAVLDKVVETDRLRTREAMGGELSGSWIALRFVDLFGISGVADAVSEFSRPPDLVS